MTATTVIYFDGPEQAGYEEWPALVVKDNNPAGTPGTVAEGDYTELARAAIAAQIPGVWEQYEFGHEPRKHTITETFVFTPGDTPLAGGPLIADATTSEDILMGFTYTGPQLDYSIEDSAEICVLGICGTLYSFKAGFDLDWALGLRLPANVSLSGPDQMVQGSSYNFSTSLLPLDWSADQYSATGVAPENGNEFVLRLNFFVGVQGEVIGIDLCPSCYVSVNQDSSASFTTPFGTGASFPIPPANIPIYGWDLDLFAFSVGLQIDPDLGSSMITADWSAVPGSDCVGSGTLTYTEPGAPVSFGPVTACNQGPTDQAQIEVTDFDYWFNEFLVTLRATLDFSLFGYGVWHEEPEIVSFDLSPLTSGLFVSDHVQCDFAFNCSEVGPDNRLTLSSTVVDETPPTTTAVLAGTPGDNGWWVSDVQVTLNALDGPILDPLNCGSGVASTEYSFDGLTWLAYSGPFTLVTEGITTLYYRSTDNEGNVEATKSQVIKIDKTPPVITGAPTTPPNSYGWWNTDVVVHFEATDAISGIAFLTPDVTVSSEGANQSVTGTAIDMAGNTAQVTVDDINIDKTPPVVTITSPLPQTYANTDSFNVQWTAVDALSGIASEVADLDGVPVTNGQLINLLLFAAGNHTLTVTALDRADNATTETVDFFVSVDIDGLIASVEYMCEQGWIKGHGICNSLLSKLNNAKAAIGRGRCNAATNLLRAFIHEVQAQRGKAISEEAAHVLKANAQYVIEHLGCTSTALRIRRMLDRPGKGKLLSNPDATVGIRRLIAQKTKRR